MDLYGPNRFRHGKSPSSDRFLASFPHPLPEDPSSATTSTPTFTAGDELSEDDVFWTGEFSESNGQHSSPPSSATSPRPHHLHHKSGRGGGFFPQPATFGILAALPETEHSLSNSRRHSPFYHKAAVSSSSSRSCSSSRLIPAIPKRLQERALPHPPAIYHQSAPVNVPAMEMRSLRRQFDVVGVDDDDEKGDGEMLPPHEIVARRTAQSPMLACSVLEGAGRTLKGRDLRLVRNAVFRRTGFID